MDWSHPRIENPACAVQEVDEIAAEAHAAFIRRKAAYPELVRLGRLDRETAKADLEGWRAIARDWRWIAYADGAAAGPDTLDLRINALDTALDRWFATVDANSRAMTEAESHQGAHICAMRWWAERERTGLPHIHRTAALNAAIRSDLGLPSRGLFLSSRQSEAEIPENAEKQYA